MNEILLNKLVAIKNELDLEIAKENAEISGINENIVNIQDLMTTEIVNDINELNELRIKLGLSVGNRYGIDTKYELKIVPFENNSIYTIAIAFSSTGRHFIQQLMKQERDDHVYNVYEIFQANKRIWIYHSCNEVYKNWKQIKNAAENVIVNDFIKKYNTQLSSINSRLSNANENLKETQRIFTGVNGGQDV